MLDGRVGEEAREAGGIWAEGVGALREVFRSTTIADIASREASEAGAGMYYIYQGRPAGPVPKLPHVWLTIEVSSQAPLVVEVERAVSTIGSDPACDIVIADDEISPKHVELRQLADGRLEIEDLDSRAGTWVGGVRLGGPATLEGGERLRIGRTELTASLERPDPSDERSLSRRATVQRLVSQSRRATLLASAAVAIAALAVVLAAAGVFSGSDGIGRSVTSGDRRSRAPQHGARRDPR